MVEHVGSNDQAISKGLGPSPTLNCGGVFLPVTRFLHSNSNHNANICVICPDNLLKSYQRHM